MQKIFLYSTKFFLQPICKNSTQKISFKFPSERHANKTFTKKIFDNKNLRTITGRCSQNSLHKDVCPTHHGHPTTLVNNHFLFHLLEYVKQVIFFTGLTKVHFLGQRYLLPIQTAL